MRNLSNRELVDMVCSATIPLIKGITQSSPGASVTSDQV